MVNMTAYHAITLFSPCQANKLFFKIRNIRNGSLYPILNRLGKGNNKVFPASFCGDCIPYSTITEKYILCRPT